MLTVDPFGDETTVTMRFSRYRLAENLIMAIMDTFLKHLRATTGRASEEIQLDEATKLRLPLQLGDLQAASASCTCAQYTAHFKAQSIVEAAWSQVFGLNHSEVRECLASATSFPELKGNTISAAALVEQYNEVGYTLDMEDVLQHQTMAEQIGLLC